MGLECLLCVMFCASHTVYPLTLTRSVIGSIVLMLSTRNRHWPPTMQLGSEGAKFRIPLLAESSDQWKFLVPGCCVPPCSSPL